MPNYTRDGIYDIDLAASGNGWLGTFTATVRATATDILSDSEPWAPVAITTSDPATTITGTLTAVDAQALTVLADDDHTRRRIPIDNVLRFRA